MELYFDTEHCKSRIHCEQCRVDRNWRKHIAKTFEVPKIDFDCPYGFTEKDFKGENPLTLIELGSNLSKAIIRVTMAAIKREEIRVSEEEEERRTAICHKCKPHFDPKTNSCKLCGCYSILKNKLETESCPIGKW